MPSAHIWTIRPATLAGRDFLERLAQRLAIGIPPWRDAAALAAAMRRFLVEDLERMGPDATVLIATGADGLPVGAATIGRGTHFTGSPQADLSELAVLAEAEGQGAGAALLVAAEAWAHAQGLPLVALATGAANSCARAFYARHGYADEDVRLVKPLAAPPPPASSAHCLSTPASGISKPQIQHSRSSGVSQSGRVCFWLGVATC